MTWKPWHMALAGGVTASSVLLGFFIMKKKREFEAESAVIQQQLTTDMASGVYAAQLAALRVQLAAHAEVVANRAADAHLASAYGLTATRMAGLQRLVRIFPS